jgi:isoaspartyl peptidase/L-asparaginase-like protein (Ntn-hydrolase superfamily)
MQAQLVQEQHRSSKNQVAELQWELRHAWEQSQQADQAQKAALQAAQDRVTKLESDSRRCHEGTARVQQSADKALGDSSRLSRELAECKVC